MAPQRQTGILLQATKTKCHTIPIKTSSMRVKCSDIFIPVVPALKRLMQEDYKFKLSWSTLQL